jgi:glycosyltransferase involved in cell wall biosynthesis
MKPNQPRMDSFPNASRTDLPANEGSPLLSVVVPTYNRAAMLAEALETLADLKRDPGFEVEIIAVDNASTDETREVIEAAARRHPRAKIRYAFQPEQGQACALNKGVEEACGEWIAIFDDDQLAPPEWLSGLWRTAQSEKAEIVGGPITLHLDEAQHAQVDPICRESLRELDPYEGVQPYGEERLPAGGNVLIRKQLFDRLGAFDGSMTRGSHDVDFFMRAREAGVAMVYAPHAPILHRVPAFRLEPAYFRWDSFRTGDNLASSDWEHRGALTTSMLCAARMVQAALVNLPIWLLALLRGDAPRALGRRTLLWRCEGYLRRTLSLLSPRLCAQEAFFSTMDFRMGRELEESLCAEIEARESAG